MNRITHLFAIALGAVAALSADPTDTDGIYADFQTSKGSFTVQIDTKAAPMAATLFVGLAEGTLNPKTLGTPFYDNQVFYSVTPGVVVQGGDPEGKGQTVDSDTVPQELGVDYDKAGVLGLFSLEAGQNGNPFFVSLAPLPNLKGRFTGFGHVIRGMEAVKALAVGDNLESVTIRRVGAEAQGFKDDKQALEQLKSGYKAQIETLLAKISEGTVATASGLRYKVLKGAPAVRKAVKGQTVTVEYKGTFLDGKVFDSSANQHAPFQFEVGSKKVIAAWDEAILDMSVGEKRLLVVPPELGYGTKGSPPVIAPNTWLVFEVELIGIRG